MGLDLRVNGWMGSLNRSRSVLRDENEALHRWCLSLDDSTSVRSSLLLSSSPIVISTILFSARIIASVFPITERFSHRHLRHFLSLLDAPGPLCVLAVAWHARFEYAYYSSPLGPLSPHLVSGYFVS